MAASLRRLSNDVEDDEYIEMELNSYSNFFCNSSIEFEFQMYSSSSFETEPPTTSPAESDELFYKGKLLPLHLKDSTNSVHDTTPFESCNVSPPESFRFSRELNPEEECAEKYRKKSPSAATAIGTKLTAYKAYMKSLFSKSSCSSESCYAARVADEGSMLKGKDRLGQSMMMKSTKKVPFEQIRHRRPFSSAMKRHHSTNKSSCSSTSSSSSGSSLSQRSNGNGYSQFLKRSNSVNVEIESPIQGAIAHCKQSQQLIRSRKNVSEVGFKLHSTDDMQYR